MELAVGVIGALRSHCARELLLLSKDVIMSECKLLNQQNSSGFCSSATGTILLALLSPPGDTAEEFMAVRESLFDDSCLTAFLELLAAGGRESCDNLLVGEAYQLLKQRTLNSGIGLAPSISSTSPTVSEGSHVTGVKLLAKALLSADSAVPSKTSLLLVGESIPAYANSIPESASSAVPHAGNKSLSIMLSMLEDSHESSSGSPLPFLLREELLLRLIKSCADQLTPCCVQLLLLLCRTSECGRRHFESSLLQKFCYQLSNDDDTTLAMVGSYLEHVDSSRSEEREGKGVESVGGALKSIRKLVMERCIAIVSDSDVTFSEELQVRSYHYFRRGSLSYEHVCRKSPG